MKEMIEIFKMDLIEPKIRANIIIALGKALNDEKEMNITQPLVYQLVKLLDKDNRILTDEHYLRMVKLYEQPR